MRNKRNLARAVSFLLMFALIFASIPTPAFSNDAEIQCAETGGDTERNLQSVGVENDSGDVLDGGTSKDGEASKDGETSKNGEASKDGGTSKNGGTPKDGEASKYGENPEGGKTSKDGENTEDDEASAFSGIMLQRASTAPATVSVYVRIEGLDETLFPRTLVQVDASAIDLEEYGITTVPEGEAVVFHAVIAALESVGVNTKLADNFSVDSYGFLSRLMGVGGDDWNYGWLYLLNDDSLLYGMNEAVINDDDDIVLYYTGWTADPPSSASFFTETEKDAPHGTPFTLTLKGIFFDADFNPYSDVLQNATILISNNGEKTANIETSYKTDENGEVSLSFSEPGEYIISAKRSDEDGGAISRPYCKVTVTAGGSPAPSVDKTDLGTLIDVCSALYASAHTEASWAVLVNALNEAVKVYRSSTSTQVDVNNAKDALQSAKDALVPSTVQSGSITDILGAISARYAAVPNAGSSYLRDWEGFGLGAYRHSQLIKNISAFSANAASNAHNGGNYIATDIERAAIVLSAAGVNATEAPDGAGKTLDLISLIANYNEGSTLGTNNAYTYALLAYDSGSYVLPAGAKYTREAVIDYLLDKQRADGGWPLINNMQSSVEITAMAVCALSGYQTPDVTAAVNRALVFLKNSQKADGSFGTTSEENSCVITALCAMGIDPSDSGEFAKDGRGPLTALLSYKTADNSFRHTAQGAATQMSTEQAFAALAAYDRFLNNSKQPVNIYRFAVPEARNITVDITIKDYDNNDILEVDELQLPSSETSVLNAVRTALNLRGITYLDDGKNITSVYGVSQKTDCRFNFSVNGVIYNMDMSDFKIVSGKNEITVFYSESSKANIGAEDAAIVFDSGIQSPALNISNTSSTPEIETVHKGVVMNIQSGTKITNAPAGGLLVPAITNTSLTGGLRVVMSVKGGSETGTVYFSKPVRLFIPCEGATNVGFIDDTGFHEITATMNADTAAEADSVLVGGVNEAKFINKASVSEGGGIAIWTNHFTTFAAYSIAATGGQTGGSGTDTVSITVKDPNPSGSPRTFINNAQYTYTDGMTAYDLLIATGLAVETGAGYYVRSIEGLAAFDHGPLSGWMYRVNGVFLDNSSGDYRLKAGDNVEWLYTRNLGKDLGSDVTAQFAGVPSVIVSLDELRSGQTLTPVTKLDKINEYIEKALSVQGNGGMSDWTAYADIINGEALSSDKLAELKAVVANNKGDFRLPTDLARTALLLQAAGYDITDFEVNLLEKIYNYSDMGKQGLNGYAFCLMVLTNAGEIPSDAKMDADSIISRLLSAQNEDGGFPLAAGAESSIDITAMVLQALAPYVYDASYNGNQKVKSAVEKGLGFLSASQDEYGKFIVDGTEPSETLSQVIIALASLGVNPDCALFAKGGATLTEHLLSYRTANGLFSHLIGGASEEMAVEQALIALTAYKRHFERRTPVYVIKGAGIRGETDGSLEETELPQAALPSDMDDVSAWAKDAVEAAFESGFISGYEDGRFLPKKDVTRAEFVTMLVNFAGADTDNPFAGLFSDVSSTDWYAPYIEQASKLGYVRGTGNREFSPRATITRQDMAVIIASFCGFEQGAPSISDGDEAAGYALGSIAAVMDNGVMSGVGDSNFMPRGVVTREMAVTVLYNIGLLSEGNEV